MTIKGTPLIASHRSNSLRKIEKYLSIGVPIIEIDLVNSGPEPKLKHMEDEEEILQTIHYKSISYRVSSLIEKHILKPYTLSEALKKISGRADIMLDLKNRNMAEKVVNTIKRIGYKGNVYVTSKYHEDLAKVKRLMPEVKVLATLEERLLNIYDYLSDIGLDGISVKYAFVDKDLVEELHGHKYLIAVWTVNDVEIAKYLAYLGVDIIVTDVPDVLMKTLYISDRRNLNYYREVVSRQHIFQVLII